MLCSQLKAPARSLPSPLRGQVAEAAGVGPDARGGLWLPSPIYGCLLPFHSQQQPLSHGLPASGQPPQLLRLGAIRKSSPECTRPGLRPEAPPPPSQSPYICWESRASPAFSPDQGDLQALPAFSVAPEASPSLSLSWLALWHGGRSGVVCREDGTGWGWDGMPGSLSPSPTLHPLTLS